MSFEQLKDKYDLDFFFRYQQLRPYSWTHKEWDKFGGLIDQYRDLFCTNDERIC